MSDSQSKQEKYTPVIPASQNIPEVTWKVIIFGTIVAVLAGMANAVLGLKYGMTVSASIPAAVIAMSLLPLFFKKVTILENNIVQTIASSGESLAAGIIFTIPAFFIWSASTQLAAVGYTYNVSKFDIFLFSIFGGVLGILMMIPLRKYLVDIEHGKLAFPEGTACAEIILAGDEGGTKGKTVFAGIGLGAVYKLFSGMGKVWPEEVNHEFTRTLKGGTIGIAATPALMGVGYIIGPRICGVMMAGATLGYLIIGPLLAYIGSFMPDAIVPPGTTPLSLMDSGALRGTYIKYIGVGAFALGGFISLIKSLPAVISSFKHGFKQLVGQERHIKAIRTDKDIPMKYVLGGILATILAIWLMPGINIGLIGVFCAVVFGFFFVVVAARIVGIVGSSSSPVSGMTIATLLVTCQLFLAFGISGVEGMVAAMTVGAIVCIAVCMSGDIAQDLKTGYLLGATPWKQQLTEFIGLVLPAVAMGFFLFHLNNVYGFVQSAEHPNPLLAPQANVMAALVQAVMNASLPWTPILIGVMVAAMVELMGLPALPFAIGLYLPLSLSTPLMVGGLISLIITKMSKTETQSKSRLDRGILFASGLVAGDALIGVAVALLMFWPSFADYSGAHEGEHSILGPIGPMVSLIAFAVVGIMLYMWSMKESRSK